MIDVINEKMSDMFDKYHVKGLPFDFVLHRFTAVADENAHDHPWAFTSHILKGGYVERIYTILPDGTWTTEVVMRESGTVHRVEAETIHEIIDYPNGECWTGILPEPKTRETRFWKFGDNGIWSRQWDSQKWDAL